MLEILQQNFYLKFNYHAIGFMIHNENEEKPWIFTA